MHKAPLQQAQGFRKTTTMNFDNSPLGRQLDAKLARYVQWEKPLRSYRGRNMGRLGGEGFTWDQFDRGLRELEAELRARYDPRSQLHPLFEQLGAAYSEGGDAERAAIRAFVARRKALGRLLWRYANGLAGQIKRAGDAPLLAQALAALAIENGEIDWRDLVMTLADLYAAAEAAGVDPRPAFTAVADLSTDGPAPGGCESLARTLREFHASSVLRERRLLGQPYGGPT